MANNEKGIRLFADLFADLKLVKQQVRRKVAKCPDCGIEQELGLFDGNFYDFHARSVKGADGERTALRHRHVYICEQCANEADSGHWV